MRHVFSIFLLMASLAFFPGSAQSAERSWGMGVASTNVITNTESLSAVIASSRNWLELDFGIHHVRHAFQFGLGGIYKFTVAGDSHTGFHVGPGMMLGTTDVGGTEKFSFSVEGLAGGHFTFGEHLLFSVDAGPVLSVVDGNVDFSIRPRGAILGAAVHYLF